MPIINVTKKPITVQALEYTGTPENWVEISNFVGMNLLTDESGPFIRTLEGDHRMTLGDFIIKGIKGEFYPCKPDIFWDTYTLADK